jgi:glutaredoxin 3
LKLELFFFPECPYCDFVLKAIDRLGIKDKIIFLNTRTHSANAERLIKDTGRRTVPCLYIDNKPMHESRDIVIWLENHSKELTRP